MKIAYTSIFFGLCLIAASVFLMGCQAMGEVLPASQSYVEELHDVSMRHAAEGDPLAQLGVGVGGLALLGIGAWRAIAYGNTDILAKQHERGRKALEEKGKPSGTSTKV